MRSAPGTRLARAVEALHVRRSSTQASATPEACSSAAVAVAVAVANGLSGDATLSGASAVVIRTTATSVLCRFGREPKGTRIGAPQRQRKGTAARDRPPRANKGPFQGGRPGDQSQTVAGRACDERQELSDTPRRYGRHMPRECVFCGGTPTTREHIFPAWAARLVGEAVPVTHSKLSERQGELPDSRTWLQPPFTQTVRVVCARCNNGWMSRLESEAEQILRPMLTGFGRRMHRPAQEALASWALKTAIVSQYTHTRSGTLFGEQASHALQAGGLPDALKIWLTSYGGSNAGLAHVFGIDLDDRQRPDRPTRDAFGATLVIGPVVLTLLGATDPSVVDGVRLNRLIAPVTQIWPQVSRSFVWRPTPALTDDALVALADGFTNALLNLNASE